MSQTRRIRGIAAALILAAPIAAQAQQVSVSAERLVQVPQLVAGRAGDSSGTELTVRRGDPGSAGPGAVTPDDGRTVAGRFELVSQRAVNGLPSLERDPQLSEDQLVIFGIGANGVEEGWQLVRDPGIVRAETTSPSGVLSGQLLRRTNATFVVTIPAPSTLQELRIYKPRWTGTSFVLDPAGTLTLSGTAR